MHSKYVVIVPEELLTYLKCVYISIVLNYVYVAGTILFYCKRDTSHNNKVSGIGGIGETVSLQLIGLIRSALKLHIDVSGK